MPPKDPQHAVVYWTKDQKAGIEPLNNVPENSRFEGSVTTVMFSGDRRWYPAKVIMISDDMDALSAKEEEIALSILEQKKKDDTKSLPRTRGKRKSSVVVGVASERQVASAVGAKPPVPKHLTAEHKAASQAKKNAKMHNRSGQDQLDNQVLNKVKVNLMGSFNNQNDEKDESSCGEDMHDDNELDTKDADDRELDSETSDSEMMHTSNVSGAEKEMSSSTPKWCGCTPCTTLEKYDSPTCIAILKDVIKLYEERDGDSSSKPKYLKLQLIPEGVRQVELTIGSGVHISRAVKDQIKVDFVNKPSALIRETLFALFGKQPFRTLAITARGNKPGTYGIEESVLIALNAFINRHLEKKMKLTEVVAVINKRAAEWRSKSKTPSPKVDSKKKRTLNSGKVVSTSPFKVRKLQENPPTTNATSHDEDSISKKSPVKNSFMNSPSPKKNSKKASPSKLAQVSLPNQPLQHPTHNLKPIVNITAGLCLQMSILLPPGKDGMGHIDLINLFMPISK
ncbi:Dihydrofolate synthase/folylpolyglutamate synthase [Frankliniella fusca]|uniref:Dihydrofolate synthase/folylpolyglutamate synthase n=1 Tax=Frankliniella fusca TaxID=407009 RepID=A0AAE1HJF8_9NEOP|nr:Dihydrofolate synthase/folylpolyglutamate synthase [Frankliniella fusca]KAK3932611.1 Dihydrofolate synthase/folylpolyglutamate synthase [Frankliniella fusca]